MAKYHRCQVQVFATEGSLSLPYTLQTYSRIESDYVLLHRSVPYPTSLATIVEILAEMFRKECVLTPQ
jgi:hypothetical protein